MDIRSIAGFPEVFPAAPIFTIRGGWWSQGQPADANPTSLHLVVAAHESEVGDHDAGLEGAGLQLLEVSEPRRIDRPRERLLQRPAALERCLRRRANFR